MTRENKHKKSLSIGNPKTVTGSCSMGKCCRLSHPAGF